MDPVFTSSLIRGIVDGDGSWEFRRTTASIALSISSANITFLQSVQKAINEMCLKSCSEAGLIYHKGANAFQLNYLKQSECNQIGEWMYNTNKIDVDNGLVM
eukprot:117037_1